MISVLTRATLVALLFLGLPAAGQQVYKCTDKAGKTVYQDGPCDGSIPRPVAPSAPKQSPDGASERSLSNLSPQDGELAMMMFFYAHCTRLFPDLHAKSAMNYQAWRLKNSVAVQRIEASPEFQAQVRRAQEDAAKNLSQPGARAQAHEQCEQMVAGAFDPPPTNVAKSPQEAWAGFMAAVTAGDTQKALGYVTPGSRGQYREILNALGQAGMRDAAAKFGELKSEIRMGGDLAFGYLVRKMPNGTSQAFEISFMRDRRSGGWFIDSM